MNQLAAAPPKKAGHSIAPITATVFPKNVDQKIMCVLYFLENPNDLGKKEVTPTLFMLAYSDRELKKIMGRFSSPPARVARISSGENILASSKKGEKIENFFLTGFSSLEKKTNPDHYHPKNRDILKLLFTLGREQSDVKILIHWID